MFKFFSKCKGIKHRVIRESKIMVRIWQIMVPAFIQSMIATLANVVNLLIIGKGFGNFNSSVFVGASFATILVSFIIAGIVGSCTTGNVYYGQLLKLNDNEAQKETLYFKFTACLCVYAFYVAIFGVVGWSNMVALIIGKSNPAAINSGGVYLKWLILSLVPYMFVVPLYSTITASGKAWVSMVLTMITIGFNILFVYLLVNQNLGHMGIKGVAIGTTLARFLELLLIICYIWFAKPAWRPDRYFFNVRHKEWWLWKKMVISALYIIPTNTLISLFFLLEAKIITWTVPSSQLTRYQGISQVAAIIAELFISITGAFFAAVPVWVSSYIGLEKFQLARENGSRVLRAGLFWVITLSLILFSSAWWWPYLGWSAIKTAADAHILQIFLWGTSAGFVLDSAGILIFFIARSGGRQWLITILQMGPIFIIYLPFRYLGFRYLSAYIPLPWVWFINDFFFVFPLILAIIIYHKEPWHKGKYFKNTILQYQNKPWEVTQISSN